MNSEKEILTALRNGSQAAFEHIYKEMHSGIFLIARKYSKSEEDAKDARSISFMRLWEKKDVLVFNSIPELYTWLKVTTRNRCIDFNRAYRIHESKEENIIYRYCEEDEIVFEATDKEAALLNRLMNHIEALPKKVKVVFKMRWLDDLLFREIAKKLRTDESTIKKRYARALELLRREENIKPKINGKRKYYYTIPMLCLFG